MDWTPSHFAALAAFMSSVAAAFSAITGYRNYRLARSIQDDAKADERVLTGTISHPELRTQAHADAVIQLPVFNKSKRKVTISDLTVYDRKSQPIPVDWSDEMNELGMPQNPKNLCGVTDAATLFIRRRDGQEFDYARITFSDSFSPVRTMITFDPAADFARSAA